MKMHTIPKTKNGFTLVELAIVLTIISLIVGGIISGEKLLEGYRLTSVVSNIEKYKKAFDDFQAQYMAYPGDVDDAGTLFPAQGSNPAAGSGDSNNRIDGSGQYNEEFKAWQHLGRANIIQGNFSGSGNATTFRPNTNVPEGPHESSMFRMVYDDLNSRQTHYLIYSRAKRVCPDANICTRSAVMNGSDALSIDIKIDDGVHNTGRIMVRGDNSIYDDINTQVTCVSGGTYRSSVRGRICTIYYTLE